MDLKDLMLGIAVVIDDALDEAHPPSDSSDADRIGEIVALFEKKWCTPFYRASQIPPNQVWDSLLESASFVLLDWKLWPASSGDAGTYGVGRNLEFLKRAKAYSVPVFIFTNESPDDIEYALEEIYDAESLKQSFVFVQRKGELLANGTLNLAAVEEWMTTNASVYALKAWDRVLRLARKDLFGSMYDKNPDWPRVFWREYKEDGVDPSGGLTDLINDSLRGRMRADAFAAEVLDVGDDDLDVPREELHALLSATAVHEVVPEHEIRCGDLFRLGDDTFSLNIRPDCDCIPRGDVTLDEIQLYCIAGRIMTEAEMKREYRKKGGYFLERVHEAIVFAAGEGRSIIFDFSSLYIAEFKTLKDHRIGRVLHPYLTRIQQRYALFLQRQGLPRIPRAAVPR